MKTGCRDGPVVYIASAFSGDVPGNTKKTIEYSRFAVQQGANPINPILNLLGVLDEADARRTAMEIDLSILGRADELWVFGIPTAGMKEEMAEAVKRGISIRYFKDKDGRQAPPGGG
ncbi:MAG: DUF4406 domain-containing protein [Lachnospiraceae bacterium]|nr:DUF4406 domain-containing protein [Lachnospiraceae bacterium]